MVRFELIFQCSWWGSPQKAEIANQVHLIVVAGSMSNLSPGLGAFPGCSLPESKSVHKASDTDHRLWRHADEIKRLAFKLTDTDVERFRYLANCVPTTILSNVSKTSVPLRFHRSLSGRALGQQKCIQLMDTFGERPDFTQPGVEVQDRIPQERVPLHCVFGQKVSGNTEKLVQTERLEHHS